MAMKMKLLGKIIGTADGWDEYSDNGIMFGNPVFNEDGRKFIRNLVRAADSISIDFETGEVSVYFKGETDDHSVDPDWSVFNK